jgi:hypothetical protein
VHPTTLPTMPPKSLLQLSLEWEEAGGDDGMDEDGQLPDSFKVRRISLSSRKTKKDGPK